MVAILILQILAGIVYGNLLEWVLHKHILHRTDKRSPFSAHWYRHHRNTRQNQFVDADYAKWIWSWDARLSEVIGLLVVAALHVWLFFVAPVFFFTLIAWVFVYYFVHLISHKWPFIGKKLFRHHYDHHMGKNQNANWCVTFPLWDYILGTREKME